MQRLARIGRQLQPPSREEVGGAAGTVVAVHAAAQPQPRQHGWGGGDVDLIDFGHSYIQGPESPTVRNAIRFWIESRTTLYDDAAGTSSKCSPPTTLTP